MERSDEVEEFAERLYALYRAGDGSGAVDLVVDDGALFVGTDSEEWWDTSAKTKEAFREQLEATGGFDIRSSDDLVGYADGNVGWIADRPVMKVGDQDVQMRMTAVVCRIDGAWKVVQGHLSVAADLNETLFAES